MIGTSGDDTDYSRAKRHKHFTIKPDRSTCWEKLEVETELDVINADSYFMKHPIDS